MKMIDKLYSLTQPQKRVWTTQILYPESPMFNIGGTAFINGDIDVSILQKAIASYISSHDAFKIRLEFHDGEFMQYFCEEAPHVGYRDFRLDPNPLEAYEHWLKDDFSITFAQEHCPLYKFMVFCLDRNLFGFMAKVHHIIADGWSIQLLYNDIGNIYTRLAQGIPLSEDVPSYKNFIVSEADYLISQRYEKDKAFWRESLLESSFVPIDTSENKGKRLTFCWNEGESGVVKRVCQKLSISINTFFVSLYILYLYKISEDRNIVIGIPVLGRSGKKERDTFGMFVNSIPFCYHIDTSEPVAEMMRHVEKKIRNCFVHQRYPYNHMVRDLGLGANVLYTSCVNYYGTSMNMDLQGFDVDLKEFYAGEQEYNLQLVISDKVDENKIQMNIDYKISKYDDHEIEDMVSRLKLLSRGMDSDLSRPVGKFCLLNDEEKDKILAKYNDTGIKSPEEQTVVSLFAKQAALNPSRIALRDGDYQVTYYELDEESNLFALRLNSLGVTSETVVAIAAPHSIAVVIAIWGILKAGGAFLPIDIQWPEERRNYVLRDSGAQIVLSNLNWPELSGSDVKVMRLDDPYLNGPARTTRLNSLASNDLAYIIYTSGSSGKPKGVMIEHHSLMNYIYWSSEQYVRRECEVFPLYSSLAFDLTITSLFTPLVSGGSIEIYGGAGLDSDSFVLGRILDENKCTIIKLTPAHLILLKDRNNENSNINQIIVGGANLTAALCQQVYESFGGNVRIYNEYGPTEATVGCMIYEYDPEKDLSGSVPIGCPINNIKIFILDADKEPVPLGQKGEIYIGGACLARGYLNNSELTEEHFTWFGQSERLYRTGDAALFKTISSVEYMGRLDRQIKMRGYRIEPQEIETMLLEHPTIHQAVATLTRNGEAELLYGYYRSDDPINESELREWLADKLPTYMIPAFLIWVKEFELTTNGKIDMSKLPAAVQSQDANDWISDNKHTDIVIQTISELLQTSVSLHDNFYQLGGDSIKAIQIASRLKERGVRLSVRDMMLHPVIYEIARHAEDADMVIKKTVEYDGNAPLTPIMEWLIEKYGQNPQEYCQTVALELTRPWNKYDLIKILHMLITHHDSLRFKYDDVNNNLTYGSPVEEGSIDITVYEAGEIQHWKEFIESGSWRFLATMDIRRGLMLKSGLFRSADRNDIWMISIHHLAVDGVSWRIILDDINVMMSQLSREESLLLTPKMQSFQAWAERLSRQKSLYIGEKDYWENITNKPCALAIQRTSPGTHTTVCDERIVVKGPTFDYLLKGAGERYNITLEELLLAAFSLAFYDWRPDSSFPIIELENHGRGIMPDEQSDLGRTVGWFTYMYPIELTVISTDLDCHIRSTKEVLRSVPANGAGYGLCEKISDRWRNENKWIRFNYLGQFNQSFDMFSVLIQDSVEKMRTTHFDSLLDVLVYADENCLTLCARFINEQFKRMDIQELMSYWYARINEIIEHCARLDSLRLTPSDFRHVSISQKDLNKLFD